MTDPTPVPTTNQGAQDIVDVVQDLEQKGEEAAEAAIIAAAPVMGTPVLKQIWEAFFDWLFNLIAKPLAMLSGRVVIKSEEYLNLLSSARAQTVLDAAKKTGDKNVIQQASDQVDQAVAKVVQYIGATRTK